MYVPSLLPFSSVRVRPSTFTLMQLMLMPTVAVTLGSSFSVATTAISLR